jgi:hypothetical protein
MACRSSGSSPTDPLSTLMRRSTSFSLAVFPEGLKVTTS